MLVMWFVRGLATSSLTVPMVGGWEAKARLAVERNGERGWQLDQVGEHLGTSEVQPWAPEGFSIIEWGRKLARLYDGCGSLPV